MINYKKTKGIKLKQKTDDGVFYSIDNPKSFFLWLDKNRFMGQRRYKAENEIFFEEGGPKYFFQHNSGDLYIYTEKGMWEADLEEVEGFGDKPDFLPVLKKIDKYKYTFNI